MEHYFILLIWQIPRASASAVAFGMGLFNGKGNLGPGKHRAFAVTSESRASDIVLRFHDCCDNYKVTALLIIFSLKLRHMQTHKN